MLCLQAGGYTIANLVWDMMQARKMTPSLPAVEAYFNGLKVRSFPTHLSLVSFRNYWLYLYSALI